MSLFSRFKRSAVRISLSLAILTVFLLNVTGPLHLQFLDRLENFSYDLRLSLLKPGSVDPRIVIIDIDERSLKEQGHWPWPRNKLAHLVDQLFEHYQIKVLGLDVVFAEKDESSGLASLDQIAAGEMKDDGSFRSLVDQLRPKLDYDQLFADSLKARPVVLGYYFNTDGRKESVGVLPQPAFDLATFANLPIPFMQASGYGANLPALQKNAADAGHFNPAPDDDGISRRVPMLMQYGHGLYESLSLAVARQALGLPRLSPGLADGGEGYAGLEWLQLGDRRIPVDEQVRALVPFRGRQGSFAYVAATDVLTGKIPVEKLQNKIVLVGTTAPGLMDLRATPVQSVYAGVEIHANMIAGILDQNIKERPAYTLGAEFVMLLLAGLILAFWLPRLSPVRASLLAVALFASALGFNLYLWQAGNLVLPIASLLLMIVLIYGLNMAYGFFVESRGKRQLAGLFGQYVPPELVDEMAQDPGAFTLEGESRELTVLFSDVRSFTTISEGLSPSQLTQLMNEYLTPMTQIIHHHRGTIDKYMGDAIMAFWGAPVADVEHARHALQTALAMIARLDGLREEFKIKGWPPVQIGVGLNTGMMTVGNMGSEFRMAYTVMGDAVNLGSRLESLTKHYGVQIIVSESTKRLVPEYLYRELDIVRVKGKDIPVAIFEPLSLEAKADAATLHQLVLNDEGLSHYRQQNWDEAERVFARLQKLHPHALCGLYLERIAYFRQNPPPASWDGVFTFETK